MLRKEKSDRDHPQLLRITWTKSRFFFFLLQIGLELAEHMDSDEASGKVSHGIIIENVWLGDSRDTVEVIW